MRIGGATEIDRATPAKRNHVSGTPRLYDFSAKSRIGVARYKLLSLTDCGLNSLFVEGVGDRRVEPVRRQFHAVSIPAVIDRFGAPVVDGVTFEAFLHQCAHNLRKSH